MNPQRMTRRQKADLAIAHAWRGFAATDEGRLALADLFTTFGAYHSHIPAADVGQVAAIDPSRVLVMEGQRSVILAIVQKLGLKPEQFAVRAADDTDLLNRFM